MKTANQYTLSELKDFEQKIKQYPTFLFFDRELALQIKKIANDYGIFFSYKNGKMSLYYKKYEREVTLLNNEYTYKGMYFLTMYKDLYLEKLNIREDQDVLNAQFYFELMQSCFYKLRSQEPELENFSHDGYPYAPKYIIMTYKDIWEVLIPNASTNKDYMIAIQAFEDSFKDISLNLLEEINQILEKIEEVKE